MTQDLKGTLPGAGTPVASTSTVLPARSQEVDEAAGGDDGAVVGLVPGVDHHGDAEWFHRSAGIYPGTGPAARVYGAAVAARPYRAKMSFT